MELSQARYIAESVCSRLGQFCERIKIGGSIRRQKPEVKDIELIVVPKREEQQGLFGGTGLMIPCKDFVDTVNHWTKVKGEPTGKYTQRIGPHDVKIDIFIVTKETWGTQLFIRTGSADFNIKAMKHLRKLGYELHDGILYDGTKAIPVCEEQEFFKILKWNYVEPKDRNV